jgi:hypothetical protein
MRAAPHFILGFFRNARAIVPVAFAGAALALIAFAKDARLLLGEADAAMNAQRPR